MRRYLVLILISTLFPVLLSCAASASVTVSYTRKDLDSGFNAAEAAEVILNTDRISFTGSGVEIDGSTVRITQGGTYLVQGTIQDGQLIVDAGDNDDVQLVLNGVSLTSSTPAAIYVMNADKVILTLAPGTVNVIADGQASTPELDAEDVNAAVFSKDDLTINGDGTLIVRGNYRHGIVSKDDLKIVSGTIEIMAVGDGIKGRDLLAVRNGNISITAQQDGMQSNNNADPERGFVYIENGQIDITAELDGIQAATGLYIKGGTITIRSGGGSAVSSNTPAWGMWGGGRGMAWPVWPAGPSDPSGSQDTPSAKGLKAGASIVIDGGSINIDSSDDAIHSNDLVMINGGVISVSSGDDGIHADSLLEINGGEITLHKCYEGLESTVIVINDGVVRVLGARDDGINAAGGVDVSALGGRVGQNRFMSEAYGELFIHGGYVFVSADGDGIDSNGLITITGGTVIVHGPTDSWNAALDYNTQFTIEGGLLVAAGSAGMAMAPSASSSQKSIVVRFNSFPAQEIVHIASSEDNEPIVTFRSSKTYQSLVVSSPLVEMDKTYIIYRGGSHTGVEIDGLFLDGTYTPGIQIGTTSASSGQGQGFGPGRGPGFGQPGMWGVPMPPQR
ncbi:MAG: carbohydrate-binding domain-containing protein [Limnochordia bacterium]